MVLEIEATKVLEDTRVGDSIATNGVCLTVTAMGNGYFSADVMPETMSRTSLGGLKPGDRVIVSGYELFGNNEKLILK